MKKLYTIISILLVFFLFPLCVSAAELPSSAPASAGSSGIPMDTQDPSPETPDSLNSTYFSIDNNNVYNDMGKAYKDG